MIRIPLLTAALLAATASPLLAKDARLATRLFNPDEVVRVEGKLGVQASIAFAEDERIENVAIGDSNSWQVTPNKRANLLFVKPLAVRAQTNMTVVTDRRTYFFDLVSGASAAPLYVLRFKYPDEPKPVQAAATPALTAEESQVIAAKGADQPVDPATLNFAWRSKGKATLLPARVYDDGMATYLQWSASTPIPAIQIRDEAGTEGPVNFAVRGDVIVIDGVPGLIVLRSGKDFATIENAGPPRKQPALAALPAAPAKEQ
ncbi:TrbG/VirB9 family P-type conjugative transfer protein [Novosphingobium arvoryzae]|uniref:TrbG/VirB9 family P-type conjugative transfer protein n=1 Tax=Novosphingobium arvoryzae TaxID=1256514 RepID=UPI0035AEB91A